MNRAAIGCLALAFAIAAVGAKTRSVAEFIAQTPAADVTHFTAATFDHWKNPAVSVGTDGVYLLGPGLTAATHTISLAALRENLLSLPVNAWPLGRVVVVLEPSVRSGNDDELIEKRKNALKALFAELHIEFCPWPILG